MTLDIKQSRPFEFMLETAEAFPASAKYHASMIWKNGGVLFCAFDGDIPAGVWDEIGARFPSGLDPFSLNSRSDQWIFVTYKHNRPAAFSAATLVREKLIFEQLASGYDYRNSGVFLLPFSYIMNAFFEKSITPMTSVVYDDNQNMKKLMGKFSFCPLTN